MALKELIQNDIKAARLGGNRFASDTLSNLKAAILNEEVATGKRDEGLSDADIEKIVAREIKKRNESIKLYAENNRPELAEVEKNEISVIEKYLPAQLSEEEIRSAVKAIVDGMGDVSMQQMGQVIGKAKAEFGNTADGATVARIVKETLA